MQGLLDKLGSNFLVAAFIPSLAFVFFAQLIFSPLDPLGENSYFVPPTSIFQGQTVFTLVLTLVLGFTLMGLNTFIYKILEGYFVLERIPWLRRRQMRKATRRRAQFEVREKLADRLVEEWKQESSEQRRRIWNIQIKKLRRASRELKAQYKQDYPEQISDVLPTGFGNIFKASELYANENFGIDAVVLWPRLIHVIKDDYYKEIDQSNNSLAFLVNCLVLSALLGILCLTAAFYQYQIWSTASASAESQMQRWIQNGNQPQTIEYDEIEPLYFLTVNVDPESREKFQQRAWLYLIVSPFFGALTVFFYYASLPTAREYGNMVRSAFDLFRFELRKQLHLPLPATDNEEREQWILWSDFVAVGQRLESPRRPFEYVDDSSHERDSTRDRGVPIRDEVSGGD